MTFSLLFLFKIRKLHFSDYLRNKARSPTLSLLFAIYMSRQVTYYKKIQKSEYSEFRGLCLLKCSDKLV